MGECVRWTAAEAMTEAHVVWPNEVGGGRTGDACPCPDLQVSPSYARAENTAGTAASHRRWPSVYAVLATGLLILVSSSGWISYSNRLHAYDTGRDAMGGHHNGNPASKVGFDKYRTAYKLGHSVVNFDDDDEQTKHQNMPLRNTADDDWRD
uniref:Uncharacterized protein n=1 Tax=Florenciella parvula TaxID=236787 RepID=A0A7S2C000_9STRA|mmetsp:Transcript_2252/g.5019  ORF Transcript_2252/g.5019 Transcript_2252/m.5019 type:complete len:152 (+) Transcript_2252:16-471(+)